MLTSHETINCPPTLFQLFERLIYIFQSTVLNRGFKIWTKHKQCQTYVVVVVHISFVSTKTIHFNS